VYTDVHNSQYLSVFHSGRVARENTHVYKTERRKRHSPVADWLESYAREPTNAPRLVHQKGKHKGQINSAELAKAVQLEQATVHRILSGKISDPTSKLVQAIAEATGRAVAEVRGVGGQRDLDLSASAEAIGRSFEQLPAAAQEWIAQQIAQVLEFQRRRPDIARLMFEAPDPKRHDELMRRIVAYQEKHQVPSK
jgi:transcriptional regulator with XRE-family HTH domain